MPKLMILQNQHIAVEKGTELDPQATTEGAPVVHEIWTFVFTDKTYGDQIRVTFGKEARDDIVKDMMGGIVMPGL